VTDTPKPPEPAKPDPILVVTFTDKDTGKVLAANIDVRLPAELTPRTALICALELVGKKLKDRVAYSLKAQGFK